MAGACRVAVRLKPKAEPTEDAVQALNASEPVLLIKRGCKDNKLYQFKFTHVLSETSQAAVYQRCALQLVRSVVDGYNGTVLAYGQTGSGKTFTMTGPERADLEDVSCQGIMPRAITEIFSHITRQHFVHWQVEVTYIEIYNESFRDLLAPATKSAAITITEQKGRMLLKSVKRIKCDTAQAALDLLKKGQSSRHVAGHGLNSRSSRSHTIFTVWIDTMNAVGADGGSYRSKLNLVDLAGSERYTKTGAQGSTATEAMHINKSLTFLEQVILALSRKGAQHVPYRSSKLTHFLKDSIGGNCQTCLIACVWADADQLNETLSTCRFAQRMMQVAVDAQRDQDGLTSVHGNLFKLDPVMQQYLEQMTAVAVAREKAKLYAEFSRRGCASGELDGLPAAEQEELDELRSKVAELEMLQTQVQENHGKVLVDGATLAEVSRLQARVLDLESAESTASGRLSAAQAEAQGLVAEMQEMRSRILELQEAAEISEGEAAELAALRDRVGHMQERQALVEADIAAQEAQELTMLQDLQGRVAELSNLEDISPVELQELEDLRLKVLECQSASQVVESSARSDAEERQRLQEQLHALQELRHEDQMLLKAAQNAEEEEKAMLQDRIRELEACTVAPPQEAGSEVGSLSSCSSPRHDRREREELPAHISQLEGQRAAQTMADSASSAAGEEEKQRLEEHAAELKTARQRIKELEASHSTMLADDTSFSRARTAPGLGHGLDGGWGSAGGEFGNSVVYTPRKVSLGKRLLSKLLRRKLEHESFANYAELEPPDAADIKEAPQIVILNTLTHAQLVELLDVHNATTSPLRSLAPNVFGVESAGTAAVPQTDSDLHEMPATLQGADDGVIVSKPAHPAAGSSPPARSLPVDVIFAPSSAFSAPLEPCSAIRPSISELESSHASSYDSITSPLQSTADLSNRNAMHLWRQHHAADGLPVMHCNPLADEIDEPAVPLHGV